jgi:hypothetical protein
MEHPASRQVGKDRLEFPGHVIEGVKTVMVEEVDRWKAPNQCRELVAAVPQYEVPSVLQIFRDEEIVRWLAQLSPELDTVESAFTVRFQRREHVAGGGAV